MVTLHGGSVKASSAGPGLGSTFTISLPNAGNSPDKSFAEVNEGVNKTEPSAINIMVVDDNVDAAQSIAAVLEARGHEVAVQFHPLAAIEAAKKNPPKVFILDLGLPEIDGYELARRLRKESVMHDALFVALTGYGQSHDRILAKSAGFDYHFIKPLDPEKLAELLNLIRH